MKVFISHKKEDETTATDVFKTLVARGHTPYLDVIDGNLAKSGDDLAHYIRMRLGECDSLIAVISEKTKDSWWVPWEIGVATEKDYPLSTYLTGYASPPEYLKKWPVLRTLTHLAEFASKLSTLQREIETEIKRKEAATFTRLSQAARDDVERSEVAKFHQAVKNAIGQS